MGGPRGALGASWGALGAIFFEVQFLIVFWIDFGTEKGAQREAFWEPKWYQNRSKNEVENEDEKETLLGGSWVDFGTFWEGVGGSFLLIFHWFLHYFRENDVFEKDTCPRSILARFGSQKVPKKHPKRHPTRAKNETEMTSFF